MGTWQTAWSRHGIARSGRLGSVMRRSAMTLTSSRGDPRFSLRRLLPPKRIRNAISGIAKGLLPAPLGAMASLIGSSGGGGSLHPETWVPTPTGMMLPLLPRKGSRFLDGGSSKGKGFGLPELMPGDRFPTRRRMNWANPRALGRAERRLGSFIHHFTKTARFLGMHVGRAPHRSRRGAFPRRRKK